MYQSLFFVLQQSECFCLRNVSIILFVMTNRLISKVVLYLDMMVHSKEVLLFKIP